MGLAPEEDQFLNSGISTEVVETIITLELPPTLKVGSLHFMVQRKLYLVYCQVASVL